MPSSPQFVGRPDATWPRAGVPDRRHPEKGLLGYEMSFPIIVQYWRSFEQLEAFAKDVDDRILNHWRQYWRRVGTSGCTGIWHEAYLVRADEYEAICGNMPPKCLGKATQLVRIGESSSARSRIRSSMK